MKLISSIFTFLVYLVAGILMFLNVGSIGYILYLWANGATLASALWDGFVLWISVGLIGAVLLSMLYIAAQRLDHASTKNSHRRK